MPEIPLGRLARVDDLRVAWITEAQHFTPWLAQDENIAQLGAAVGLSLEVEAQEKEVGPFRADILCRDTRDGSLVLIENQLERTDHIHLGQVLTYAAGLEAVTIVWIARSFTEEHRATLDWLNRITDEHFNFFGLEIELWQIGTSAIAPKFNVVCKPNNWSKQVTEGKVAIAKAGLSEGKQLQLEFWTAFDRYLSETGCRLSHVKPLPMHYMNFALGRSGLHLAAVASLYDNEGENYDRGELRAEVVIHHPVHAKSYFASLEVRKGELEAMLGEPLTWRNPTDARMCRIYFRRSADIGDRSDWPSQQSWLKERLERLHRIFAPIVKELAPGPSVSDNAG